MPKVSIILPAYNEEKIIASVLQKIHAVVHKDYEIIVVDDGSIDATAERARHNGARVIQHPYNIGNGAAIKTGIRNASGEILLMMDADGQHDPQYIPQMLSLMDRYDMVVAARLKGRGIPLHRRIANKIYNTFASYLTSKKIADLTSGFRAVRASIARKFVYILPNTFSYPTTLTLALFRAGHSVAYLPCEVHPRTGMSKINLIADGIRFLLIMMKIATLFNPLRIFLPPSFTCFLIAIGHAIYKIAIRNEQYTGFTIMFFITGVMIFLMGLIAEQIAQLRLEGSEKN